MATTGIVLFGWTVLHLLGNLLVFAGPEVMNRYGKALQDSPLIWLMRLALLLLVAAHMRQAWATWRAARAARPVVACKTRYRAATRSGRAMRAGGVAIAGFVVYHVLHFYGVAHPSYVPGDVHHNSVTGFGHPLVVAVYLVATFAFCAHLRHGLASATRSLGLGRLPSSWSSWVAAAVGLGFAAPCVNGFVLAWAR